MKRSLPHCLSEPYILGEEKFFGKMSLTIIEGMVKTILSALRIFQFQKSALIN
jgi:hypothetical protein